VAGTRCTAERVRQTLHAKGGAGVLSFVSLVQVFDELKRGPSARGVFVDERAYLLLMQTRLVPLVANNFFDHDAIDIKFATVSPCTSLYMPVDLVCDWDSQHGRAKRYTGPTYLNFTAGAGVSRAQVSSCI
jgi:hypothetical protein